MFETFYNVLSAMGYSHPLHPAMTHLPVGLVMGGFVFALTGMTFKNRELGTTAFHCLILGLISALPTMALGFMDWHHYYGGAWLYPVKVKIVLAISLLFLLGSGVWLRSRFGNGSRGMIFLYALCLLNVVGLGYFGGELVYGTAKTNIRQSPLSRPAGVSFADVEKIFQRDCTVCHSGSSAPLGLALDSYGHIVAGAQDGPVIVPGKPEASKLVRRIRAIDQPSMPLGRPSLSESDIELITRWVQQGAPEAAQTGPRD